MPLTNRSLGNQIENDFCNYLFSKGFWVHRIAQNSFGQPADVIAVKDEKAYLIDCKACTSSGFRFSRMESNQEQAMELWERCGNGTGWFAVFTNKNFYMLSLQAIKPFLKTQSGFSNDEIIKLGIPIKDWVDPLLEKPQ